MSIARCHHGADRTIAQPHDAGDHGTLAGLDNARRLGFRHQTPDFFIGDAMLGLRPISESPEDGTPGNIQEPDDRRANSRQHRHGGRHADRDPFRVT